MSYLKLRRTQEIGVEIRAKCQACGSCLLSDVEEDLHGVDFAKAARIIVKVPPFCSRCLRERDERMKGEEIAGATTNREGK